MAGCRHFPPFLALAVQMPSQSFGTRLRVLFLGMAGRFYQRPHDHPPRDEIGERIAESGEQADDAADGGAVHLTILTVLLYNSGIAKSRKGEF